MIRILTIYCIPVMAQPINYTVLVRILCTAEAKLTYMCPYSEKISNLEESVEIIVMILPTLWSTRARPDRRSDLRNTVPMTCFKEKKESSKQEHYFEGENLRPSVG